MRGLLDLAQEAHARTKAEIIMTNFMLPARHDLGTYRSRTLGSDWSFRKWINLELGLRAPAYLHLCDMEFLAYRQGGIEARSDRAWFESKQPSSPALLVALARENRSLDGLVSHGAEEGAGARSRQHALGRVVADDGLEGIELGDTSPRGEAFKPFRNISCR